MGSDDVAACAVLSDAKAPTAPSKPTIFLSILISIDQTGGIAQRWSTTATAKSIRGSVMLRLAVGEYPAQSEPLFMFIKFDAME